MQGNYPDAENLYLECIKKLRVKLLDTHPDVLKSMNYLADLYDKQGKCHLADQVRPDFRKKQLNAYSTCAVNDVAKGGIDRLGFDCYAAAIFEVLSESASPLCVGLYGRQLYISIILKLYNCHKNCFITACIKFSIVIMCYWHM